MRAVSKVLNSSIMNTKCLLVDSVGQGYESDDSENLIKKLPPENQKFLMTGGDMDILAFITNKKVVSPTNGDIDIDSSYLRINGDYPSSYQLKVPDGNIFIVNGKTHATVLVVIEQVKKYEVPMHVLYASVIGDELLLAGMKHRTVNAEGECTKRGKAILAKLSMAREAYVFDSFGLRFQEAAASSVDAELSSLRVRLESWLGGASFKNGHVLIGGIADLHTDDDLVFLGSMPGKNDFVGVSLFYLEDDEIQPLYYLAGKEYLSLISDDDSLAIYLSSRESGCNMKISDLSIVIIDNLKGSLVKKAIKIAGIPESAEISRFNVRKLVNGSYIGLIEEIISPIKRRVWQINSNNHVNWTAVSITEIALI
ncbi:hypothetical protein EOE67_11105 [Rheinheimera riviphila]|uniref:Uncharacterized protein n=1 Tax=Rheinheimera riviphila TaxID=1834037 RepID=A0A437QRP1_9GAMM|nr:hypothetical protein [Rheinheimera riviphila]RVU37139.1 hypothetical protein EOE67_11105 [Rheinheimera riviphila]